MKCRKARYSQQEQLWYWKVYKELLVTCSHITFCRSVLSGNFAAASLEKYLYWGDETETPMGSLAKRQFSNLVFKFMLFSCWYPVTHAIPSRYLHFHIICPCCLSEKKKKKFLDTILTSSVCLRFPPPTFFPQLSGVQYFILGFGFFSGKTLTDQSSFSPSLLSLSSFFLHFPSFSSTFL